MRAACILLSVRLCMVLAQTLTTLAMGTHAIAQEAKVDPKAQAIIDQALAAYGGLKAFHEKVILKGESNPPGLIPSFSGTVEVRLQKPNKLWLKIETNEGGKHTTYQVACDGVHLWRWSSDKNTYTKAPAPSTLGGILIELPTSAVDLEMLLYGKDPLKVPWPAGTTFTLADSEKGGEVAVDVLTAKIADPSSPITTVFKMMVGQQDHLVRGYSFWGSGKHPQNGKEISFQFEATYPYINAGPTFSAKDFLFTPPPGVKLATPHNHTQKKRGKK